MIDAWFRRNRPLANCTHAAVVRIAAAFRKIARTSRPCARCRSRSDDDRDAVRRVAFEISFDLAYRCRGRGLSPLTLSFRMLTARESARAAHAGLY